jgi:hypothetical protein
MFMMRARLNNTTIDVWPPNLVISAFKMLYAALHATYMERT